MAQTDARPGFRLPWSADRQAGEPSNPDPTEAAPTDAAPSADSGGWPSTEAASDSGSNAPAPDAPPASDPLPEPVATADTRLTTAPTAPAPVPVTKKPTRFMADLTKAMQAAAEDARSRAVAQLATDAKTQVESIHGRASTEAASLRRAADDDVAGVREWSKAEIARIREETENRITDRKARLESEIDEHAGVIEREIDAVQKTVAAYEAEMAAFFERLLGEEDPSRFATMAENLPEPPTFESVAGTEIPDVGVEDEPVAETGTTAAESIQAEAVVAEAQTVDVVEAVAETVEDAPVEAVLETAPADAAPTAVEGSDELAPDAPAAAIDAADAEAAGSTDSSVGAAIEFDREAAFAAIQAAAEAAASAEVAADAGARAEAGADVAIENMGNNDESDVDPRFAALALSPDFDAAEAEAFAAAGSSDEDIPEIDNEALAARLAGLTPARAKDNSDASATQVVVVGLISVASIASFKRHLGRLAGVQSVGVSSGPDGEFVFLVNHGSDVVLREVLPSLPTFQARVTGSSDGVIHVTAHDPEADA